MKLIKFIILWHVDPFLGNDRKISSYTTAVANTHATTELLKAVFSMQSVPRLYTRSSCEANPGTENIGGLKLAAVRHTTVQVTRLPL
jgi:hypothetical protein